MDAECETRDGRIFFFLLSVLALCVCTTNVKRPIHLESERAKHIRKKTQPVSFDTLNIHFDTLNFDRRKKKEIKKNDSFEEGKRA